MILEAGISDFKIRQAISKLRNRRKKAQTLPKNSS
jgi:hypothetical protein